VVRVPLCVRVSRVSRVFPGSPRCLFTGNFPPVAWLQAKAKKGNFSVLGRKEKGGARAARGGAERPRERRRRRRRRGDAPEAHRNL
jgi:hypothetical protein